jgi:transcriptional regulator with XRE-family HTH domain
MIGDTLKRLRGIYGYKAVELREKLGISSSYLSEIENNRKSPSLELLQKYSEIFDIKLSSLISIMESYNTARKQNKAQEQITKLMIGLIDQTSSGIGDKENEESD